MLLPILEEADFLLDFLFEGKFKNWKFDMSWWVSCGLEVTFSESSSIEEDEEEDGELPLMAVLHPSEELFKRLRVSLHFFGEESICCFWLANMRALSIDEEVAEVGAEEEVEVEMVAAAVTVVETEADEDGRAVVEWSCDTPAVFVAEDEEEASCISMSSRSKSKLRFADSSLFAESVKWRMSWGLLFMGITTREGLLLSEVTMLFVLMQFSGLDETSFELKTFLKWGGLSMSWSLFELLRWFIIVCVRRG